MNFEGIKISRETASLISAAVDSRRLQHALLIEGGSEEQRLGLARLLAKSLVCSAEGERPCGKCENCLKAAAGFHPDISEALADISDTTALKIDNIRSMRASAHIVPNEAQSRVFIITNTQLMSEQSQNALLKILEEPPEFVSFILTCDSRSSMLQTVLSRTALYSLGQALDSRGGEKQAAARSTAEKTALALLSPNELDLMRETGVFEKDKELLRLTLKELILLFRDASVKKAGGTGSLSASPDAAAKLASGLTAEKLFQLSKAVNSLNSALDRNSNQNLTVTRFCSLLRTAAGK